MGVARNPRAWPRTLFAPARWPNMVMIMNGPPGKYSTNTQMARMCNAGATRARKGKAVYIWNISPGNAQQHAGTHVRTWGMASSRGAHMAYQ